MFIDIRYKTIKEIFLFSVYTANIPNILHSKFKTIVHLPQVKLLKVSFYPYYKVNEPDVQHWYGMWELLDFVQSTCIRYMYVS